MNYIKLGGALEVSRIGLGAMGMSAAYTGAGQDEAESIRTIHRALELGVTFIDTAEVYGPVPNEELVGHAIKGRRHEVVLATKFGFISNRPGVQGMDSTPENIRLASRARSGDLERTSTCTTSTGSIRRPRSKRRSARLLSWSKKVKLRHIGLSEAWVDNIRRAHAVHRSRPCSPNTRYLHVTLKTRSCRSCASLALGLFRTLRSVTAS